MKTGNAMKLKIELYSEDEGVIELDLDARLQARIIQEEVWAQTSWPAGESPIAELLDSNGSIDWAKLLIGSEALPSEALPSWRCSGAPDCECNGIGCPARGNRFVLKQSEARKPLLALVGLLQLREAEALRMSGMARAEGKAPDKYDAKAEVFAELQTDLLAALGKL